MSAEPSAPTAFISYAQSDPSWSHEQSEAWKTEVLELARVLISQGVDVELDQFHFTKKGVDWNRFGPQAVRDAETVILAVSRAYKQRLEGGNAPTEGAGAVREADEILGLLNANQELFRKKIVVVVLPGATGADVPAQLSGHHRFEIGSIDAADPGLESLFRLLTDQPAVTKPPIGDLRKLDTTPGQSEAETAAEVARLRTDAERLARTIGEVDQITLGLVESGRRALPEQRGIAQLLAEHQRVLERLSELEQPEAAEKAKSSELAPEEVLTAIRAAAASVAGGEVRYTDVAQRLGRLPNDPEFQRLLARAETAGLIVATASVDQLPGPILFEVL